MRNKLVNLVCVSPCVNAFENFKHLPSSVYNCLPTDCLHTSLLGLLKVAAKSTFGFWTNQQPNLLDSLARKSVGTYLSLAWQYFQIYSLDRGLSNLTLVSGSEWVGFWFIIIGIGRPKEGKQFLIETFDKHYIKVKRVASTH